MSMKKNNRVSDVSSTGGVGECRRVFRPIFLLLLAFGFDFWQNPSWFRRCVTHLLRLIIFIFICNYLTVYLSYRVSRWDASKDNAWSLIICTIETVLVAITYVIISVKMKRLGLCFEWCIVECSSVIGNDLQVFKTLRKPVLRSVVVFTLSVFIMVGYVMLGSWDVMSNVEDYEPNDISKYDFTMFTLSWLTILVSLCVHMLFVLTYTTLCNVLSHSLTKITDSYMDDQKFLMSVSGEIALENPHRWFIASHRKMCKAICLMDDVFSQLAAAWHLAQLVIVVFLLKQLQSSLNQIAFIGLFIIIVGFLKQSLAASSVNEKILNSLKFIIDIQDGNQYGKVNLELEMYVRYRTLDPPGLSGWGLYYINRNFIINSVGSVITYVLVVYNING